MNYKVKSYRHFEKGVKKIGLHYIYDKSERESISNKELQDILKENGVL